MTCNCRLFSIFTKPQRSLLSLSLTALAARPNFPAEFCIRLRCMLGRDMVIRAGLLRLVARPQRYSGLPSRMEMASRVLLGNSDIWLLMRGFGGGRGGLQQGAFAVRTSLLGTKRVTHSFLDLRFVRNGQEQSQD